VSDPVEPPIVYDTRQLASVVAVVEVPKPEPMALIDESVTRSFGEPKPLDDADCNLAVIVRLPEAASTWMPK
jgi:hypothetical protein